MAPSIGAPVSSSTTRPDSVPSVSGGSRGRERRGLDPGVERVLEPGGVRAHRAGADRERVRGHEAVRLGEVVEQRGERASRLGRVVAAEHADDGDAVVVGARREHRRAPAAAPHPGRTGGHQVVRADVAPAEAGAVVRLLRAEEGGGILAGVGTGEEVQQDLLGRRARRCRSARAPRSTPRGPRRPARDPRRRRSGPLASGTLAAQRRRGTVSLAAKASRVAAVSRSIARTRSSPSA